MNDQKRFRDELAYVIKFKDLTVYRVTAVEMFAEYCNSASLSKGKRISRVFWNVKDAESVPADWTWILQESKIYLDLATSEEDSTYIWDSMLNKFKGRQIEMEMVDKLCFLNCPVEDYQELKVESVRLGSLTLDELAGIC